MICAQLGQSGDFGAYSLECSLRMELGPIKILGESQNPKAPAVKREAEEDWSR
jgi:hypothetical protein